MNLKVEMKNVQSRTPITPGLYNIKVTNLEVKDSQSGNPMIVLQLTIQDRGDFKGRTVRDRLVFAEGAMWRVHDAACALDYPIPSDLPDDGEYDIDPALLMGAVGQVHITNRVWAVEDGGNGQPRPQVSSWIAPNIENINEGDIPF